MVCHFAAFEMDVIQPNNGCIRLGKFHPHILSSCHCITTNATY